MNKTLSKYLFYYPVTLLRGEKVFRHMDAYEQRQWLPAQEMRDYQHRHLAQLCSHACDTTSYHRERFASAGIDVDNIASIDDISSLPVTGKADIIAHSAAMQSDAAFLFKSLKTTGGSTGQAVTITKNADALARERAATWRAYRWANVDIGDVQARFWGVPLTTKNRLMYRGIDFITNRIRLSAFHFSEHDLRQYYARMQQVKPVYLYGYVSMIAGLARFVKQQGLPRLASLRSVITTSEVLDEESRAVIEDAFQVKVFNEYGCGEVGSIAHECEHGSMHLMADNIIAETDTSGSPDGSSGRLIITDLHNYAMPLIRYDIGDFGTLSDKRCACGRGLPVIERIHGRAYDIIRAPDGTSYHPEILMYIFEHLKAEGAGISQFQVIQKDVDQLQVSLITVGVSAGDLEQRIIARVHADIHPDMKVSFDYVDAIQREPSGKLRVIKSELS